MIALRFSGGNRDAAPSERWSARDGFGARVVIELARRTLVREHTAGEGFAAQNSATMRVGIGEAATVERLEVRWPSGVVRALSDLPSGSLVWAHEDPSTSPTGEPFVVTQPERQTPQPGTRRAAWTNTEVLDLPRGAPGRLTLYTTMATWCAPCVEELPSLAHLRRALGDEHLTIFGIPHDQSQTREELDAWVKLHAPSYEILDDLSPEQHAAVRSTAIGALRAEGLPVSIVTGDAGRVLLVRWGPPTVSELRLLRERGAGDR
ncbi:MAG: ASPIC/UnbV domain-containing protein [Planctomycetota bacterium]|nr:ASPIC/UnbV domain-containing protein [Planctomycetota bacterium]